MLSDAQWALLEPLIEACRPKGKTQPQDLSDPLAASEQSQVAGCSDLHPLGPPGCLGAPAPSGAGARDPARHDLPGRHQRAGASESRRSAPKGALKLNETIVKHLAAIVAVMASRPA
jgi:hypothetical protein